jgi:hypothetical protein
MRPSDANEHVNNDAHAEGKAGAAVYRKRGLLAGARHWLRTLREVTHQ